MHLQLNEETWVFEDKKVILVIPDLHWKNTWEKEIEYTEDGNDITVEKVVFLGDYVDDYPPRTDKEIYDNLVKVIEFKKRFPDKVDLLFWNHDIQYIFPNTDCSWKRKSMEVSLWILFKENLDLFKVCVEYGNIVFSHAGFTNDWFLKNLDVFKKHWLEDDKFNSQFFNNLLKTSDANVLFQVWFCRNGYDTWGWPLWADKDETEDFDWTLYTYKDLTQVVWHSKVKDITMNPKIIYADCLDSQDSFCMLTY